MTANVPLSKRVAIARAAAAAYTTPPPFHPSIAYPELASLSGSVTAENNAVYAAVRESFRLLELDPDRYGAPNWNPLGEVVRPGDKVLIKPNWVSERNHLRNTWEEIITHGAVLRPIIDYLQLALSGEGSILLADGPMLDSDFEAICERSGVSSLVDLFASRPGTVPVDLIDLRSEIYETKGDVVVSRKPLPGDPAGSTEIDLGEQSAFFGYRGEGRYYGADYDAEEVNEHHTAGRHEYRLSRSALEADVLIDVPKLKTHTKAGVTLALKGIVGINTARNWLPHHTQGTPDRGGDQFASSGPLQSLEHRGVRFFERASLKFPRLLPPVYRFAKAVARPLFGRSHETVRGGGWHGNDTIWRMVLDINRALTYATATGEMRETPVRRRFCVIDGIVAGEGAGPVFCDSRACGIVLAGGNPVAVDTVATELMGFDHLSIPVLARAWEEHPLPLIRFSQSDLAVVSNDEALSGTLEELARAKPFLFNSPIGWEGSIERGRETGG